MTQKPNDGGPAFPIQDAHPDANGDGMSLRDWFAGRAMAGMYANTNYDDTCYEDVAQAAYNQADAMLEHRNKEEE